MPPDPELELGDEAEKVFLCTKGKVNDISPELKALLDYIAGKAPESELTRRIEAACSDARMNPRWRKEYMDLRDYVEEARKAGVKEGRAEGLAESFDLAAALILAGRTDDVIKAGKNAEFREKLYEEFGI